MLSVDHRMSTHKYADCNAIVPIIPTLLSLCNVRVCAICLPPISTALFIVVVVIISYLKQIFLFICVHMYWFVYQLQISYKQADTNIYIKYTDTDTIEKNPRLSLILCICKIPSKHTQEYSQHNICQYRHSNKYARYLTANDYSTFVLFIFIHLYLLCRESLWKDSFLCVLRKRYDQFDNGQNIKTIICIIYSKNVFALSWILPFCLLFAHICSSVICARCAFIDTIFDTAYSVDYIGWSWKMHIRR